jgi:hypothetical protein
MIKDIFVVLYFQNSIQKLLKSKKFLFSEQINKINELLLDLIIKLLFFYYY